MIYASKTWLLLYVNARMLKKFLQNSWRLLGVNYFRKKLQLYNLTKMNCSTCMFRQYI